MNYNFNNDSMVDDESGSSHRLGHAYSALRSKIHQLKGSTIHEVGKPTWTYQAAQQPPFSAPFHIPDSSLGTISSNRTNLPRTSAHQSPWVSVLGAAAGVPYQSLVVVLMLKKLLRMV
jgi:hypothetical protein